LLLLFENKKGVKEKEEAGKWERQKERNRFISLPPPHSLSFFFVEQWAYFISVHMAKQANTMYRYEKENVPLKFICWPERKALFGRMKIICCQTPPLQNCTRLGREVLWSLDWAVFVLWAGVAWWWRPRTPEREVPGSNPDSPA
jgi:hypothetical protein